MKVSSKVPANYHQTNLITYLAHRFTYLTAAEWQQQVEKGRVWHNGRLATASIQLCQGDDVGSDVPDFTSPPANFDYSIVYEDGWLVGVNKPAGLRVHGNGRFTQANLIYHLRHHHFPTADLVNRLDAQTSGVVVVAKDKETLRRLHEQFATQAVEKTYLALVHGIIAPASGQIDLPIAKQAPGQRYSPFVATDLPYAKPALTLYETVAAFATTSLLRLWPKTGRTHQLRVHLTAVNHPILGDDIYGRSDNIPRLALHCHHTSFTHPHTGWPCHIHAPWPADLQAIQSAQTVENSQI
ncbi:MAG: RluA family pseudouridine synthase [Anaerolineales bacterium]|nr:RluA family pseudouridine synthase [Anaerolineales bacterium]